jgi:hypothetical protein
MWKDTKRRVQKANRLKELDLQKEENRAEKEN